MWPRSRERGNLNGAVVPLQVPVPLQCGRAHVSAETGEGLGGEKENARSLQCGRAHVSAETSRGECGRGGIVHFNVAALT